MRVLVTLISAPCPSIQFSSIPDAPVYGCIKEIKREKDKKREREKEKIRIKEKRKRRKERK